MFHMIASTRGNLSFCRQQNIPVESQEGAPYVRVYLDESSLAILDRAGIDAVPVSSRAFL